MDEIGTVILLIIATLYAVLLWKAIRSYTQINFLIAVYNKTDRSTWPRALRSKYSNWHFAALVKALSGEDVVQTLSIARDLKKVRVAQEALLEKYSDFEIRFVDVFFKIESRYRKLGTSYDKEHAKLIARNILRLADQYQAVLMSIDAVYEKEAYLRDIGQDLLGICNEGFTILGIENLYEDLELQIRSLHTRYCIAPNDRMS